MHATNGSLSDEHTPYQGSLNQGRPKIRISRQEQIIHSCTHNAQVRVLRRKIVGQIPLKLFICRRKGQYNIHKADEARCTQIRSFSRHALVFSTREWAPLQDNLGDYQSVLLQNESFFSQNRTLIFLAGHYKVAKQWLTTSNHMIFVMGFDPA